jgi:hypothetical protein
MVVHLACCLAGLLDRWKVVMMVHLKVERKGTQMVERSEGMMVALKGKLLAELKAYLLVDLMDGR